MLGWKTSHPQPERRRAGRWETHAAPACEAGAVVLSRSPVAPVRMVVRKTCPLVSARGRSLGSVRVGRAQPFVLKTGAHRAFLLARPAGLEPATPGLEGRGIPPNQEYFTEVVRLVGKNADILSMDTCSRPTPTPPPAPPTIEDLRAAVAVVSALLANPSPGSGMWHRALCHAMDDLQRLWSTS